MECWGMSYSVHPKKVVITRSEATWQSDEVAARAKPAAISGDPLLHPVHHAVQGFARDKDCFTSFAMTFKGRQLFWGAHYSSCFF